MATSHTLFMRVRILALLCGAGAFYSLPRRALVPSNALRLASADEWLSASSERMDALAELADLVCGPVTS